MFQKPLNPFQNTAAGQIATLRVNPEKLTLNGILLKLTNTIGSPVTPFVKSHITNVRLMAGNRTVIDLTGAELDAINSYKNEAASTTYLHLDFTERDQPLFPRKEIGGYDLMTIFQRMGELVLQVTLAATPTNPKLDADGFFTPSQGNPLILKYVKTAVPAPAAGKLTLPVQYRGALIKRLHMRYTGTDWTASANGNLNRVEVKRNGLVVFDQFDLDARFNQARYRRVPQSRVFTVDPGIDYNDAGYLTTVDRVADGTVTPAGYEINAYLTAVDTITVIAELLDLPENI
jgi:hypothetical protein